MKKPVPPSPPPPRHIGKDTPKLESWSIIRFIIGFIIGVLISTLVFGLLTSCAPVQELQFVEVYQVGGVYVEYDTIINADTMYYYKIEKP